MKYASVGPIAIHLPEQSETNEQLAAEFPSWNLKLIHSRSEVHYGPENLVTDSIGPASGGDQTSIVIE